MRKLLSLTTLLSLSLLTFSAAAEHKGDRITSGTMMFGGNVYYQHSTVSMDEGKDEVTKGLSISPTFGYFIVKDIALLGKFTYTNMDTEMGGETINNTTIGVGLGGGFYLPKGIVTFYMNGLLEYHTSERSYDGSLGTITDREDTGFGISLSSGVLIMLTKTWAIDTGVRFNFLLGNTKRGNSELDSKFLSFQIGYFGLQAFF